MKIAIVSPTIDVTNGWGNYTFEYCSHLFDAGVNFTLFLPEGYNLEKEKTSFPVESILPKFVPEFKRKDDLNVFLKTKVNLKDFDVIHSLISFPYAILAEKIAQVSSKPFLITTHGSYAIRPLFSQLAGEILKHAYLKASLVISPSRYTHDKIREYVKGNVNLRVIPHAVNYERFQFNYDISTLKREYQGDRIILNIGELKPRKGQHILIKAVKIVKRYVPNIKCLLIGRDGWGGYLHSLVDKLGLSKEVNFLGKKRGEELVKYLQLCDVFVHTPCKINNKFEGFGIVYLEAGACGKPVIGSTSGGVPDAVKDGITGILVPEGSVRATAKAIIRLLKDERLCKKLGEGGRRNAEKLRWKNYVETMKGIYESCLTI